MTQFGTRRAIASVAIALILFQFVSLGISGTPLNGDEPAHASEAEKPAFEHTWARTDKPVAEMQATRTWMWGPSANTIVLQEPYADSPNGMRDVQYFDKSRMEITHPDGGQSDPWYVTNGLLVSELVSGDMQVGDKLFVHRNPAEVNVAGDPDDESGPTYATFAALRELPPLADGAPIIQRLSRDGSIVEDSTFSQFGVTAALHVSEPGLDHRVASVFLDFMRSTGIVYINDEIVTDRLFESDFYATGLPIAEAYWTTVRVAGAPHDVLVQCFERRCLTYTPGNQPGWEVEAGNVGLHYYQWRSTATKEQTPTATGTAAATTTTVSNETSTSGPSSTSTQNPTNTAQFSPTPVNTATATNTAPATSTPTKSATATNTATVTRSSTPTRTATSTPTITATSTPTGDWFPDGIWNVGEDIDPGTYRNSNSSGGCLWQRLRSLDGEVIDENFSHQIQVVSIYASDSYFRSQGCGIWTKLAPTPTPTSDPNVGSPCLDSTEATFLALINEYRGDHGLSPLAASGKLNSASYNHSLDMGQRDYFAHDTLSPLPQGQIGPGPDDRMAAAGYSGFTTWGENIAAGYPTAQAVFDGWRNSSGHNANMLNPNFTQIGIGLAVVPGSQYTNYWTTDFANGNDSSGC